MWAKLTLKPTKRAGHLQRLWLDFESPITAYGVVLVSGGLDFEIFINAQKIRRYLTSENLATVPTKIDHLMNSSFSFYPLRSRGGGVHIVATFN